MGNDSWSPYSMQKYATHGTRSRGGAWWIMRSFGERSPRSEAQHSMERGGAANRPYAGRVMTVVSAPLLSSITQRTDLLHGHVPPTRFNLGIAFTPCSTVSSPATTLRTDLLHGHVPPTRFNLGI